MKYKYVLFARKSLRQKDVVIFNNIKNPTKPKPWSQHLCCYKPSSWYSSEANMSWDLLHGIYSFKNMEWYLSLYLCSFIYIHIYIYMYIYIYIYYMYIYIIYIYIICLFFLFFLYTFFPFYLFLYLSIFFFSFCFIPIFYCLFDNS